jgi:hypothetical protein
MRQDTGTGSDELRILQLGWMLFVKIFSDKDKELELIQNNYTSPKICLSLLLLKSISFSLLIT